MRNKHRSLTYLFCLIGICLWGALIYSNTLHAPFVFDDKEFIMENPGVKVSSPYFGVFILWNRLSYRTRIIPFLSFLLNYRLHGGAVLGYHLVNLIIHLMNGFLVIWLVLLLFRTSRMKIDPVTHWRYPIALLSSIFFLSHPIQTEAVTFISQRFELLAALFYLSTVCFYLKARMSSQLPQRMTWFLLSFIFFLLGIFSKEIVATLPFLLILIEWLFFKSEENILKIKNERLMLVIFILISGLFVCLFSYHFFRFILYQVMNGLTSSTYLLTEFRVIMKYLSLLFLPLSQNLDYDFRLSHSLGETSVFMSLVCLMSILWMAFRLVKKYPLISFSIFFFFLVLVVTSSVFPIPDVIFEHRLYLPSVGFVIFFCSALFYFLKDKRVSILLMISVILTFSFVTYQRNWVWADEVLLWRDVVQKSPNKFRGYSNLARAYREKGEYEKAIESYCHALKLVPKDLQTQSKLLVNLGTLLGTAGKYPEALDYYLEAIKLYPKNIVAYSNAGYIYTMLGDYKNGVLYGEKAIQLRRRRDESWNNLGVTYLRMKRYPEAAAHFEKALKFNLHNQKAKKNLEIVHALQNIQK